MKGLEWREKKFSNGNLGSEINAGYSVVSERWIAKKKRE